MVIIINETTDLNDQRMEYTYDNTGRQRQPRERFGRGNFED